MLAWLPTYFTRTLDLDLGQASTVSLLPPVAGFLVSLVAGQAADGLMARGVGVGVVRRTAQATAFLAPAGCLAAASATQGSDLCVAFVTAGLGLNSFALAGLYCTHADMSPEFAGPLLGLTNTAGAVPGIIGVATVGYLLDQTGSWQLALMAPTCVLFLIGTAVYSLGASSELQDFSNNEPFAVERWLARAGRAVWPRR